MRTKILSVVHEGVEYRCEEISSPDSNKRSKWFNQKGGVLDDAVAEKLLKLKAVADEELALRSRLWPVYTGDFDK